MYVDGFRNDSFRYGSSRNRLNDACVDGFSNESLRNGSYRNRLHDAFRPAHYGVLSPSLSGDYERERKRERVKVC